MEPGHKSPFSVRPRQGEWRQIAARTDNTLEPSRIASEAERCRGGVRTGPTDIDRCPSVDRQPDTGFASRLR